MKSMRFFIRRLFFIGLRLFRAACFLVPPVILYVLRFGDFDFPELWKFYWATAFFGLVIIVTTIWPGDSCPEFEELDETHHLNCRGTISSRRKPLYDY